MLSRVLFFCPHTRTCAFLEVLFIPVAIKEVFSLWYNGWLLSSILTDIDFNKVHYTCNDVT